jgi:hypothetical protein
VRACVRACVGALALPLAGGGVGGGDGIDWSRRCACLSVLHLTPHPHIPPRQPPREQTNQEMLEKAATPDVTTEAIRAALTDKASRLLCRSVGLEQGEGGCMHSRALPPSLGLVGMKRVGTNAFVGAQLPPLLLRLSPPPCNSTFQF